MATAPAGSIPTVNPFAATALPGNGSIYGAPVNPTAAQLAARTAAVSAPAPSSTPTISSMYGSVSPTDQSVIDAANSYKGVATTPVDEQSIRNNVMNNLQSEIDATNKVYVQKLADAQMQAKNLAGSTTAANARAGLIGSDFGTANDYSAASKGAADIGAVGDARTAAIQAITDRGNTEANAEIANKQSAQKNGADSYINFLNSSTTRQQTRTTTAAAAALAQGIDLSSLDSASIKAIADSYQIDPASLVSSYVSSKNALAKTQADLASTQAQTASTEATTAKPVGVSANDSTYQLNPTTGKYELTQAANPTDATLKEYKYAVTNDGFTGSLADWNAQKANQKVSLSVTHDPITGALQTVQRAGPQVAGTGKSSAGLPAPSRPSAATLPAANANPTTKPPTAPVANPLETLKGSDLAYAQSGLPAQAKFKYPGQIDAATARIQKVIPGWTPANAAASYQFFKSPATQQFIANSNTVLNTLDQLKSLSSKVPRGSVQLLAGGQLALAQGVSDPNAAKFVQLASIAGDEAGKLLGSSGGSDFTTQLGLSLINVKYSDATFGQTIDQLAGRVNNKIGEYYKQAGTAAGNQGNATPLGTGTPKSSQSDSDFVEQSLSSQGVKYDDVISATKPGEIPVVLNSSGAIGHIPANEFDPSIYTKM